MKLSPIWILRFTCFCQICGMGFLPAFEVVQMRSAAGLDPRTIGWLLALENGLLILLSPLWGRLADRTLRYREIVAFGSIGMVFTLLVFAWAKSFEMFVLYAILRGVFMPVLMGIMPTLAVVNIGNKAPGRGFGGYRAYGSIGFMVATWVLPFFFTDVAHVALAASVIFPLSIFALFALANPTSPLVKNTSSWRHFPRRLYLLLFAVFIVSFSEPGIHQYFGEYARTLGASTQWIGFLAGITGLIALLSLFVVGHWVDLKGPRLILLLAFLAQSARLALTGMITDLDWLWLPHLFHFIGWAGKEIGTILFVIQIVGPSQKATAMSLALSFKMGGMMVGSLMMGYFVELWGFPHMFFAVSAITLSGCVILLMVPSGDSLSVAPE